MVVVLQEEEEHAVAKAALPTVGKEEDKGLGFWGAVTITARQTATNAGAVGGAGDIV